MAWTTDTEIKTAVASLLKLSSVNDLPSHWDDPVTAANTAAYNWLRGKLAGRGYSPSQMNEWDARRDYNRRAALCHLYREMGLQELPVTSLDRICESLKEMDDIDLTADGELLVPENAGGGSIGTGAYADSDDIHTIHDVL